eukprot:2595355-Karenia_brevis.AAC.1
MQPQILADAQRFREAYNADVQFVFSRVQHHCHKIGKDGERQPMQYCEVKRRRKQKCCKRGFPRMVIRDPKGKIVMEKYRP